MDVHRSSQLDPVALQEGVCIYLRKKLLLCLDLYLANSDNCTSEGDEAWGSTGWRGMGMSLSPWVLYGLVK